jgi:AmmeMemoRadiSam system protein B
MKDRKRRPAKIFMNIPDSAGHRLDGKARRRGQGRILLYVLLTFLGCTLTSRVSYAQAALQAPTPQGPQPTLEEVRRSMGIPSEGDVRGQRDAVGFASTAVQMEKTWELSATPPVPERLGEAPPPGVAGVICPHDDYLYAGRVYRQVLPLVTAKTVILVGVFHGWRRFAAHDVLVFDDYRAWRTPDGEVPVSGLRAEILAHLGTDEFVRSAAWHDSEHSLEALLYWLRHVRPDLEIVPVIVPVMNFSRMDTLASHLGAAIAEVMARHGLVLGRDLAIAVSSDAVHYGDDFQYTAFGEGGVDAYVKACDQDKGLLRGPLAGDVTTAKAEQFFATCVKEDQPAEYRLPWCGRFSVPLGLLLLEHTTAALGLPTPVGHPLCYGTSISGPELKVREFGMGSTAPANLYHFVGYPAVAYTVGATR